MSPLDIQKLQERRAKLKAIVKEQFSLSKTNRDQRLIDETYAKIKKVEEWLGVEKSEKVSQKKKTIVSKKEFKAELNKMLGTPEPSEVMTIDTIEELKEAWPIIRGKNIQINAPREVILEARRLNREDQIQKKKS